MYRGEPYLLGGPYGSTPPSRFGRHYMPIPEDDGMDMFRKLWRRKLVIVVAAVLGGVAASAAAMMLTPRYTADTALLLGVEQPHITDIPRLLQGMVPNEEMVQSQSYVLTSRGLAAQVAHRLALDKDPEFNPALRLKPAWKRTLDDTVEWVSNGVTNQLIALGIMEPSPAPQPPSDAELQRKQQEMVVNQLVSRLEVLPMQRSHVLAISAQSESPETAARIANAVARTYIEQQMIRRSNVTLEANQWLDQRVAELRKQVEQSERAVEEYRRQHGLFETGNEQVRAQQVTQVNTQLIMAESEKASVEARLAQVRRVEQNQEPIEALPSVVNSPLIQALLQRQIEAERYMAELASTYGDAHPKMRDIRAQLADIQSSMNQEVSKVVQSLRHEVDAAQARVDALRSNLASLQGNLGEDNAKMIQLRQLERQAEANRRLLVSFLDRSKETELQPSEREQDATVISEATIPLSASYPPTTVLRVLGVVGGALVGMLIALFRENLDRTFRTTRQVEEATNLPILGVLPPSERPFLGETDPIARPDSLFSRAVGNLYERLVLAPEAQARRVIMLTSATPHEGKSRIAVALTRMAARNGMRAIILDCDWRRPTVDRYFTRQTTPGLSDLLAGMATPDEVVFRDPATGAHAIFAGDVSLLANSMERSVRLELLLETLARHYDLVILDTPPVLVGPDAQALARISEEVAFVSRWGKVSRDVVIDAIRSLTFSGARFGGVILSDVDPKQYRRYGMGDVVYPYPSGPVSRAA